MAQDSSVHSLFCGTTNHPSSWMIGGAYMAVGRRLAVPQATILEFLLMRQQNLVPGDQEDGLSAPALLDTTLAVIRR